MSRTLFAGRSLTLLALAGLAIAACLSGPSWTILLGAALAAVGLLLVALSPAPPGATGLDELLHAADELDSLFDSAGQRLNSDPSIRGRATAAARRLREAAQQIRVERSAAQSTAQSLRSILDAVDEPILATDPQGRILICNAAAHQLLGLRADRLDNRPVEEAFTQPDLLSVIQSARTGTSVREEIRVPRPDGPRIWSTSAIPYGEPTAGQRAIVLTVQDVTQQSLTLQVKTDFVANASHELRTPIAAIRMAVETLESLGPDDQAMHARLMSMIASHTHRLEELIRDLLDLSRLESSDELSQAEPVPASTLAAALAPMFEGVCRDRRLTLYFDFSPELEQLSSDRNLLLLILSNLIDNACKFAFEGTEVRITGQRAERPASVRFEVTDQGVGIPIAQQQRVFERFFQVDEARTGKKRGTGLGLSIVKHAVRRLGGTIKVHSVWQRGTTMTVELPECLPASTQPLTTPSASFPPRAVP